MSTLLRNLSKILRLRRHVHRRRLVPTLEGLDQRCLLDAGIGYVQTSLVSDIKGLARTGLTHHNRGPGLDGDSCFLVKPKLLD